MKKLIIFCLAFCSVPMILHSQFNAIDEIFDRYSERDGITTVYISSKMFSLFAGIDNGQNIESNFLNRIKSIRILSVEDPVLNEKLNLYEELNRKLNLKVYEELMVVKEGKDITKFLIKQNGDIISELLMITGGPGNNTLISIRGDLDLRTISEISKKSGIEELKTLENVEKKE